MWKKIFFTGTLLLGLGLFVVFIQKFGGLGKALEAVAAVGWLGVALFVLNGSGTLVFPAIGWWILMRSEGIKVSIWTTLKTNFMGFPINFIAPSMFLGAEPLKMLYVARATGEPNRKILATIIVGKFQEIGALLSVMVIASAVALWRIRLSTQQTILLVSAMSILLAAFVWGLWQFVGNREPTVRIIGLLARLGPKKKFGRWRRRMARLRTRAEEMEHIAHRAFTRKGRTFVLAQAFTLFSSLSILMRPWIYFYFSKHRMLVGPEDLCAIFIVTNLINMLPHTPGALGVMELGMGGLFQLLSLGADGDAPAYQVVARLTDIVLILFGGWLIFHYNLQAMARRIAKGQEKVGIHEADGTEEEPPKPTSA